MTIKKTAGKTVFFFKTALSKIKLLKPIDNSTANIKDSKMFTFGFKNKLRSWNLNIGWLNFNSIKFLLLISFVMKSINATKKNNKLDLGLLFFKDLINIYFIIFLIL